VDHLAHDRALFPAEVRRDLVHRLAASPVVAASARYYFRISNRINVTEPLPVRITTICSVSNFPKTLNGTGDYVSC
jgi:hypothetical protein